MGTFKTAVLLAAGRGKRLRPYTDTTPKPLLPVDGRPTLDFVLDAVVQAGVRNVCLVVGHLGDQIQSYVGDGSRWGVRAYYCQQVELLGTAHALNLAIEAHPSLFVGHEGFFLTATDYLLAPDFLASLVRHQSETGADIVASLKEMSYEELIGRSSIRYHDAFVIDEIVEKPTADNMPSQFSANLIYLLPSALQAYLPNMSPSPRGEYEIQALLNQMIKDGYQASGLVQPIPAEWEPPVSTG